MKQEVQEKENSYLADRNSADRNSEEKKCQICDSPLRNSAMYCNQCGALWCESDGNMDTREIRILEPTDFALPPSAQLFRAQACYSSFAMGFAMA
ncbi:MAG: hypothetical protein HOP19_27500 [Acidobacteria bacterium]|nr:hypothetical protein [Acidobacteriota bacterium]